jgi:hypothetical protein
MPAIVAKVAELDPLRVFTSTIRHHSPGFWGAAVRLQLARVEEAQAVVLAEKRAAEEGDTPRQAWLREGVAFFHTQNADAHFLLVAMRNVLRSADRAAQDDHDIAAATSAFYREFPDVHDLRDMLEHLDEYAIGQGKLQRAGRVSADNRGPHLLYHSDSDHAAEIEIRFGAERRVPLKAAALSIARLADRLDALET